MHSLCVAARTFFKSGDEAIDIVTINYLTAIHIIGISLEIGATWDDPLVYDQLQKKDHTILAMLKISLALNH